MKRIFIRVSNMCRMKRLMLMFCCVLILITLSPAVNSVGAPSAAIGEFYIDAGRGNDSWTGRSSAPTEGDDDGPVRTFRRAIDVIRAERKRFAYAHVYLYVMSGVYFLLQPIVLDNRDSGLTITRYLSKGDRPRILGATTLRGDDFVEWISISERVREFRLRYRGKCSNHLFINGKRLIRARKPNLLDWHGNNFVGEGPYLSIENLLKSTKSCDRNGAGGFKQEKCAEVNRWGFVFRRGDMSRDWKSLKNGGELMIFQSWTGERVRVRTVTRGATNRVMFETKLRQPIGEYPMGSGWRYIIENTYEVLDSVGEFYCSERRKFVSVVLKAGELEGRNIYVAQNPTFFKIKGATDIHFMGLSFEYTGDKNFYGYNANPAALQFVRCSGIEIVDCRFKHMGHTALSIRSSFDIQIKLNIFEDIGYKGVVLEYDDNPSDPFATRDALVRKNRFNGCGIMNMLQPSCIHVRGISRINVIGNRVSRSAYAGIMIGWQKTFSKDFVKDKDFIFRVRRNHVFEYGKRLLNDFAGIYASTNQPDCGATLNISLCHVHALIEENVIHEGHGFAYGGKGIYTDTAASSITVRRNWLSNLGDASIAFHCGTDNTALNNMIVHKNKERLFGLCNKSVGKNGKSPTQTAQFTGNVIAVRHPQAMMWRKGDYWSNETPRMERNLYHFQPHDHLQLRYFFPKQRNISEWRASTRNDRSSLLQSDPRFASSDRIDLRLADDSPAVLKLAIDSVDLRGVVYDPVP